MTFRLRRKSTPHESAVPMIIVALLIGVIIGFASGWETSSLQFKGKRAAAPASPVAAPAPAPTPEPAAEPAPIAVTYRAVVDKVGANSLIVTVLEGATGEPQVELIVGPDTMLVALRPVMPAKEAVAADTTKGLPPPPEPPAEPYEEIAMTLAEFRVGDVVEFSTGASLEDGSLMAAKVVWIMNLDDRAGQPGAREDGTAPLKPRQP